MRCRLHLLIFAVLMLINIGQVVCRDIRFNKVSPSGDTINRLIPGTTQDLHGNIWLSSGVWLLQYDGVHTKTYIYDPLHPSSVTTNILGHVYADENGNI
jgi:hypothetical protein